jgi:RNA polymerase sigma-70 factor (sigma-E family)
VNRGDEAEFEAFVARSGRRLLRTAYLLCGDRGEAQDLVQVVLERTARRWAKLDGAPEAYARTVLVNASTDRWRRRSSRFGEVPGQVPDTSVIDVADGVVLRGSLIAALRQLTARQRALLVLRYFEDVSESEAAALLGISVGAVKSGTSRALDRLRDLVPATLAEENHR